MSQDEKIPLNMEIRTNKEGADAVERRASERSMEDVLNVIPAPMLEFELPQHRDLFKWAMQPENYKGGVQSFYHDSDERLTQQLTRVKHPDCSAEEINAMCHNNLVLHAYGIKRMENICSRAIPQARFHQSGGLEMTSAFH
ncbi:MAG: hypothetical protein JSS86_05705 [Cyanobacteria bacterium SZAS LIN-2]|nr:hypothetical protein [Cyanobacteria bacterium SZAS LIN-3]MBS1995782.1 hypothetical protein [Cyanobacteria bacterium SZAS LIN-2]MBS2010290.1 hypothetical protein [Cyanobacteria bacterium SZAS TMP-1]